MKASEAYTKLINELGDIGLTYWGNERSKVDETKTLIEMFNSWLNLFENYPNMNVKSIVKYNIEKDFPSVFSSQEHEIRNNADSSRESSRLSGVK